jgi:hypothetical protein
MIFVCKLRINKIKGYLYSTLSLSGQPSGSPYRVRQIMVAFYKRLPTYIVFISDKMYVINKREVLDVLLVVVKHVCIYFFQNE